MLEKLNDKRNMKNMTAVAGLIWVCVQLYFMYIHPVHPLVFSPIFLCIGLIIIYINKPFPFSAKIPFLRYFDLGIIASLLWVIYYYASQYPRLSQRISFVSKVELIDMIAMCIIVAALLEAVRRTLGNNLLIFVVVFMVYMLAGKYMPGILNFKGFKFSRFPDVFTMNTDGIYGTPLTTAAGTIFYFMFFGAFFTACNGGQVLIDIGMKVSRGSAGGAAQAAVISSGLMGMISGSAAANVSSTGVMTIPMMKKAGYKPEQAAAVEAVASTGGQIMPPIMGVGAFIMAELLGISYRQIALSALIPAVAYFGSVLFLVTLVAKKNSAESGDAQKNAENLRYEVAPIMPRLFLLLPAFYLVYRVLSGSSLRSAALFATIAIIVINMLPFNKYRVGFPVLIDAFVSGAKQAANLALPTAACGIVIASVTQSGFANRLSSTIAVVGQSNLLIALIVGMLGCMLLGMALPTAAAYLIAVVLFVPVMIKIGLPVFVAHMFCFYYGAMAQITPPVCLASFTAASIADADSWKTGWIGFAYASVAFLVPYNFAFQPAILLIGSVQDIIISTLLLAFGVFALTIAVSGYLFGIVNKYLRILFLLAAIMLIFPETISSVAGLVLLTAVTLFNFFTSKKKGVESSYGNN